MTHTSIQRTGFAALGATSIALLFANIVGRTEGENGSVAFYFVSLAICAAIGLWLFTRVLPAAIEAGAQVAAKRSMLLSGVALVLSVPAFWSGTAYVVGAAGAALGYSARARGAKGLAIAGIAIGLLAIAANTVIITMDELA